MFHKYFIINPSGYILANILFLCFILYAMSCTYYYRVVKQEWNSNIFLVTKFVTLSLSMFLTFVLYSLCQHHCPKIGS